MVWSRRTVIAHLQIPWIRPQGTIRTAALATPGPPARDSSASRSARGGPRAWSLDYATSRRDVMQTTTPESSFATTTKSGPREPYQRSLEGRLMLFMVIERFTNRDAKAAYRRFRDGGVVRPLDSLTSLRGLNVVGTVVSVSGWVR